MDFSKLFKLGNRSILEDTEEKSLEGKEDKEIRKIILDNFSKLFPLLELYNEGKQSELPVFQVDQKKWRSKTKKPDWVKKPDSLAFSEKEKTLYILEYKSKIDEDLLKQTQQYRNFLQNESILSSLILKWNKQVKKFRELEDFKDNKAKIICISPKFDYKTIWTAEENPEEEIYLIKITKLEDKKGNLFILLQSKDFEILNFSIMEIPKEKTNVDLPGDKIKKDESDDLTPYPLLSISGKTALWLLKENNSNEQVKKWVLELNRCIIKESNNPYLKVKSWYYSLVYIWKSERVLVIRPRETGFTIYLQENEIVTQDLEFKQSKRGWFVDNLIKRKSIKQEAEFYKTFELVKNYLKKVLI